ncbi:Nucleoporin nup35 [Chamberlinius hualienensis]
MIFNQDLVGSNTSNVGVPMSTSPPYLPEYLLGDKSTPSSPMPSRSLSVLTNSSWSNLSSTHSHGLSTPTTASSARFRTPVGDKQGGPPIYGLYDQPIPELSSPFSFTTGTTSSFHSQQESYIVTPVKSRDASILTSKSLLSQSNSHLSPAQLDPFYTQGENLQLGDELDETWVTVFGFPPSAVGYILQQFSQYGNILHHKMTGGNNWIHLHFQTKIQAKKALAKNGKILCGNMMIGVLQCIDKKAMMEVGKENALGDSHLSFTPNKSSFNDQSGPRTLGGMRPLTQAYKVAANCNEVIPGAPTLHKKSNPVTKAVEYLFGM